MVWLDHPCPAVVSDFQPETCRPLAKLAQVTANLPEKLSGARSIVWPASSTREVDSLIGNFGSMTKALEANFHELRVQGNELRQVNLGLEQEIQERKHAEEKLEQSVSLLNATLESTVDGILVVDRKGGVVSFNRKFPICGISISRPSALVIMRLICDCPAPIKRSRGFS